MATVFVILQLLGRFFSEIIRVRNIASHSLAPGPRFFRNSGWMLSYPERRGSVVVSTSAWYGRRPGFDSRTRHVSLLGVKTWLSTLEIV